MFDFKQFAGKPACITSSGRRITYGNLDKLSKQIANFAEPHQLVFNLCRNTIGAIAGYAAFLRNNNAQVLLDAGMDKNAFDNMLKVYRPRYIWAPANCRLAGDAGVIFETESYVLWQTNFAAAPKIAGDLALLLTTSGSTGSPKLVRLSRENLCSNAQSIIEYLHISDQERPLLGLPMHYAYGLSIVNSHLLTGGVLLLPEYSLVQKEFWQFANEHGFTSYSGVPYAFETIKRLGIWKQEMPSLRTITQAGGALNPELIRFFAGIFEPRGVKFYVMYGQAEATARIAYLEPEYLKTKTGSIGKAIPGGRLSLLAENGKTITCPDTAGELVYEGKNVCLGYAETAEDLSKGNENGGVLRTGDEAYRDAEGFYYIIGRKSRFTKLFGHRISLDHVENILQELLTECACLGNDDEHLTIFTPDAGADENAVIDLLSRRTKIPRPAFRIQRVKQLPRAASGKVQYGKLEKMEIISHE